MRDGSRADSSASSSARRTRWHNLVTPRHDTVGQVAMLEKQIPRINPDTRNLLFKLNAIDVEGEGGGAGGGNGGRNKTR